MSRTFIKTVVLSLSVLLTVAPFALAQGTTGQTSPGTQRPGMSSAGTKSSGGASSHIGTMGMHEAISATVAEVDQQNNSVTLRMQDGETIELKVPQTLASDLQMGDSVQVTIRKADTSKPGMGGTTTPPSPGGTTTPPRSGQTR
jgi:hypothetical protein